jgi:uncharacterized repeat protein (TIGR01451 family)
MSTPAVTSCHKLSLVRFAQILAILLAAQAATAQQGGSSPSLGGTAAVRSPSRVQPVNVRDRTRATQMLGKIPLSFEPNQGQADERVAFVSRGPGYNLFLTSTEAVFALRQTGRRQSRTRTDMVRLGLVGANAEASAAGLEPLPGRSHYLRGNDVQRWHTDVPHFSKVRYHRVYPAIDLVYYGNQRQLEYDFVVAPRGDPDLIRLQVDATGTLELDSNGDLLVRRAGGVMRWLKPVAFQMVDGRRVPVSAGYLLRAGHQFSFWIGDYDRRRELIIDPVLAYSTLIGGTGDEVITALGLDADGNVYVAGHTLAPDFPITAGAFDTSCGNDGGCDSGVEDVFVTKLNATGDAVIYSTFIGGGGRDFVGVNPDEAPGVLLGAGPGSGLFVDATGNVFLAGNTESGDFPTTPGAFDRSCGTDGACNPGSHGDAYVLKLNATGAGLLYSTYLGGSRTDAAADIAVDSTGNAYVTGFTRSPDFPTSTVGVFQRTCQADALAPGSDCDDAFVVKLDATGAGVPYGTYLGGSDSTAGFAIAVDGSGNAYVAGETNSPDFPTTAGALKGPTAGGFFASANGGSSWTSRTGTLPPHKVNDIAIDPSNSSVIYVATQSGGVFKTTDAGLNWSALNTGLTTARQHTFVVDPVTPTTLYVGSHSGLVAKSVDSGANWAGSSSGIDPNTRINQLAIDPLNPQVIYAATRDGLYKTTNGGSSWTLVLDAGTGEGGSDDAGIFAVAIDPTDSDNLYVVFGGEGVLRSRDGGSTWDSSFILSAEVFQGSEVFQISDIAALAVNPAASSTVYLGALFGVYKSTDSGASFSLLLGSPRAVTTLAIDPENPDTIYAGTFASGLQKSTNGGSTWSPVNTGLTRADIAAVAIDPSNPSVLYAATSFQQGFVSKLDSAAAALTYSTFLGGSSVDAAHGLALDGSGNAHVTGVTISNDIPVVSATQSTHAGWFDAFVLKLNSTGTGALYHTYLGGSDFDFASAITVDGSGNAFVVGATYSFDFPLANPLRSGLTDGNCFFAPLRDDWTCSDAFITQLNSSGAVVFSTYWGGGGEDDQALDVALDADGFLYVAGLAESGNGFFATHTLGGDEFGFPGEAFVLKIGTTSVPADLSIAISHDPEPAFIGQAITFTITVTNQGPSSATGVVVYQEKGNVPGRRSFNNIATPSQGTCDESAQRCDLGTLSPNASATLALVDTFSPFFGDPVPGTVTLVPVHVGASQGDPDPSNNSASDSVTILQEPLPGPVGPQLLFGTDASAGNLLVINPSTAAAVSTTPMDAGPIPSLAVHPLTGQLYAGQGGGSPLFYAVDASTGHLAFIGDTDLGFAAISALDFRADGVLFASVNLAGDGGTGGDHLATINIETGAATIIGPYGNCTEVVVPGFGGGSCTIDGMEGIAFAPDGTLYGATNSRRGTQTPTLYTINTSTGAATPVVAIRDAGDFPPSGGVVSIDFDCGGTLYGGTATPVGEASDGGDLIVINPSTGVFTKIGKTTQFGNSLGALAFSQCQQAVTGTDLGIVKTASASRVTQHDTFDYTLTVTNHGPDAATSITVTDALPPQVSFVSVATSAGSCSGQQTVSCSIASLASQATATITITVHARFVAVFTNTATVSSADAPDPVSSNNSSSVEVEIAPSFVFASDHKAFGFGGMRGIGTGEITVSGVTSNIIGAFLYWHGPTNSSDPAANATVSFNGATVVGTNLGFSADNCWGFSNSQAYKADVTSLVTGDGVYPLANFTKPGIEVNGVSLLVIYDDGNAANNRDLALFEGNDSNIFNSFDPDGWDVSVSGINYSSGTATLELHVADGQTFTDGAVLVNGQVLVPTGAIFEGNTVPNGASAGTTNGGLWDIRQFDVTSFLSVGLNTLRIQSSLFDDCLSLIAAGVSLPAGAAPEQPTEADLETTPQGLQAAGTNVSQQFRVRNLGPALSAGVTFTDRTANAPFVSASSTQGTCTGTTGLVTCNLGSISPGASVIVSIVTSMPTGWSRHEAQVTSSTLDPDLSNNLKVISYGDNQAPLAVAGTNRVVSGLALNGTPVTLDGSASSDPNGDALSYRWTGPFPEGGGVVTGRTPTVTLAFGTSKITLVVSDGGLESAPAEVLITVSDFGVAVGGGPANVIAGQSATYTVTISSLHGAFEREVALGCSGLPAFTRCVFSPVAVTPNGTSATATLTLMTNTVLAAKSWRAVQLAWLLGLPLAGVVLCAGSRRRRLWLLGGLLALAALQVGCGGGGTAATNTMPVNRTPAGIHTITVTAVSGALAHSSTVNVEVR